MYVYAIQAGAAGPIKIGCANDVLRRLGELQVANHEELHLIACWRGGEAGEGLAHEVLFSAQIRGEWFRPTEEVLAYVRRMDQTGELEAEKQAMVRAALDKIPVPQLKHAPACVAGTDSRYCLACQMERE